MLDDTTALLCRLLGHVEGGDEAVKRWLAGAGFRGEPTLSLTVEGQIANAAANLVDERLALAHDGFLMALRQVDRVAEVGDPRAGALDALARLGAGMVENRRRRFPSADTCFADARRRAGATGHPLLARVADYLWAANLSDLGHPSAALLEVFDALERPAPADIPTFLVEAARARYLARLLYRAGNRDGALEALENVIGAPLFQELSAIVRGVLLRERGIVHTFCEDPATAREDMRAAKALFERVGYAPGVVRATHSLARSHLFLDTQEAEDDLNQARSILRDQGQRTGREMAAELADLESRIGDLFFVQGQFEDAERHYRRDRELTLALGGTVRSLAYIDYSLGRVALARERHADAIELLGRSAEGFARVEDPFNQLRSRQLLVEALIEARAAGEAEAELREVEALLTQLPDPGDRPKQQAALMVLRARVLLRCRRDPIRAQAHLHEALRLLHGHGKDAHFIRVLLSLAETHAEMADPRGARKLLVKGARLAEAAGLQDLVVRARRAMAELPGVEGEDEQRSDIEAAARRDGLVEVESAVLVAHVRGLAEAAAEFGADALRNLARLLSEYSGAMAGCAELHDGQLVRFDGDSLLVLFSHGPSWPREVLAMQAALQMLQRFRDLRERWRRRWALPPDHELGMGVGIASGRTIAGYFGITSHRDFAAVGAAVSHAFALERASADGQITVSWNVSAVLHEWWPKLGLRPVEIVRGAGQRVLHAFQVDGEQLYPKPLTLYPPGPSSPV